jgi:hypothetical protein
MSAKTYKTKKSRIEAFSIHNFSRLTGWLVHANGGFFKSLFLQSIASNGSRAKRLGRAKTSVYTDYLRILSTTQALVLGGSRGRHPTAPSLGQQAFGGLGGESSGGFWKKSPDQLPL